jgi:hypothetical protein
MALRVVVQLLYIANLSAHFFARNEVLLPQREVVDHPRLDMVDTATVVLYR